MSKINNETKQEVTKVFNEAFKETIYSFNGGMVNKVEFPAVSITLPTVPICANKLELPQGFTPCHILPNEVEGITVSELGNYSQKLQGFKLVIVKSGKKSSITAYRDSDKMVLLSNCSAQTFLNIVSELTGTSKAKLDSFYQKCVGRVTSATNSNTPKIDKSVAMSSMLEMLK